MEQIYTIPVNEAFDASVKEKCTCPFCTIFSKLEKNEIDMITGAAMMEPSVRMETNEKGFCKRHFDMMMDSGNRLSVALIMESHLETLKGKLKGSFLNTVTGTKGANALKKAGEVSEKCYVCEKVEFHFAKMFETCVYLYDISPDFKAKFKSQPMFCLPHYTRLLECAKNKLDRRKFIAFYNDISEAENAYIAKLKDDVSWFCKKFDYRYENEPWNDSKDAPERTVNFLCSKPDPK